MYARNTAFIFCSSSAQSEKKMINQKFTQNLDGEFAEKCRKALEKAYGVDFPMPKCRVKRATRKKFKLF
jgi:hypothetical protein